MAFHLNELNKYRKRKERSAGSEYYPVVRNSFILKKSITFLPKHIDQ